MTLIPPWAGASLDSAAAVVLALVTVAYCVAGEPFVGRVLHRRMEQAVAADPARRIPGYRRLLALELALAAAGLVVVLLLPGVGLRHLGLALPHPSGSPALFWLGIVAAFVVLAGVVLSTVAIWHLDQPIPVVGGDRVRTLVPRTRPERTWFLGLAVAAGVCEELLYRGVLLALVGALLPGPAVWPVVLLGAIAFGAAHLYQGAVGTLVTAVLGLLLGAIFVCTGSLPLVMLLHAALDARVGLLPERALAAPPSTPAR